MQDFTFLVSLCLISLLSSCSVWSFRSAENIKKKMTFLMGKFGVFPGPGRWWAQPKEQLVVVCLGNSEHLWAVLGHGVTSLWGHRAGANASSELQGDLMKQRPHQRSTRRNFKKKIKTLHSCSIILFHSAYCWSHSCCQMLRSLIAASPGRARSVLGPVLWVSPLLALTCTSDMRPLPPTGVLSRALLWAQPLCLCVLCLLTFEPWELLHTASKNSPECCNTVK